MSDGETPGVGAMIGTPGACPEIQVNGKRWTVGRPDQDAKARLENLAKKVAIDEVRKLKGILDAAAYAEAMQLVVGNLRTYETWREGWQAVIFDPGNSHLFLWSLMQAHHPDISESQVADICKTAPEEVTAAFAQVIPDFFTILLANVLDRLSPEDQQTVQAAMEQLRHRLTLTPARSSTPSGTASLHSRKSRGASRPAKSAV